MVIKEFVSGKLDVRVYPDRAEMGAAAAKDVAECIRTLLAEKKSINIVFAAAPSQNEFLSALSKTEGIEWSRINALHMDEYVNLPQSAPQSFGNFLRNAIFDKVPFASVEYIGCGNDSEETCRQYDNVLRSENIDIVCMGIGENGHIAFNDPHVAMFDDPLRIKVVDLDLACRRQQVHDGCFASLDDVPQYAVTLTVPTLMSAGRLFCMVPAPTKAHAVRSMVFGPVSESCPASILRTHPHATLYTDTDSAKEIL